jgi:hypothetical protein
MSYLRLETCFHVGAVAIVVHAMVNRTDLTDAVTAAAAISSLGRVAPTERVDKALDKDIRDIGKKQ